MGQEDARGFVYNAPALPEPPSFSGSTKAERRTFIRQYNKYLDQVNALQVNGSRPFVMPVSACMEVFTKKRVAMWDLGNRDYRGVTEDEWAAWFGKAYEEEPQDLDVLKKRLATAIKFDTNILDADSRIGKMLDNLMRALERDDQAWVLDQEGKIVVDLIVKAIKPVGLQKSVQRQLALQRNKPLKTNVYRFVDWLRVHTAGYHIYASVEEEKPASTPMPGLKGDKTDKTGGGGGGGGHARRQQQPASSAAKQPPGPNSEKPERKKATCLKCGREDHKVGNCPKCAPGEAERLLKQQLDKWEEARQKRVTKLQGKAAKPLGREAKIEGVLSVSTALLDTGSDITLVTAGVIKSLEQAGIEIREISPEPLEVQPYGASPVLKVDRQVQFRLVTLDTPCGPLALRGLNAWVDSSSNAAELLISRSVMERLGFSEDDLLSSALAKKEVWDVSDVDKPSAMARVNRLTQAAASSDACGDDGMHCATPDIQVPTEKDAVAERLRRSEVVEAVLQDKLQAAQDEGLTADLHDKLRQILANHSDVFRLEIGYDEPIKVEPLRVRLKPGAVPVKCGLRRYPPAHVEFLKTHVRELEAAGLVYRNNRATWASAPRIVPKKDPGDLRMTIDSRPINACTEPMPWPMPNLDAALTVLVGAQAFFTLDWFKGYWQLALHEDSQMYYSFMTPFGVYTPTRVLMGQTDAVAFCQSAVNFMFADILFKGLLAWLDDMLGYAESPEDLLDLLDQVLTICSAYGLKLNPKKCDFFLTKATWCGKVVSANGVEHSPSRIQGLCALVPPATAADLQQFLCATNWMRSSIPCYTELVAPLRQLLDEATKTIGSAKKTKLIKVQLAAIGWVDDHLACFTRIKKALLAMVPLAHPRADMMVCLYTDASDGFWGAIATQVPFDDLSLPLDEQRHQPLAFLSGAFTGASERWSIVEKEAFAVVESCKRLDYILIRPAGFRLFTDHKNLQYIFNPAGQSPSLARYQAHKLERWALVLSSFPYTIECLPGDDNVWGDLLSRWGACEDPVPMKSVRHLVTVVSPLQQADFD